jgi:hypothetical protein
MTAILPRTLLLGTLAAFAPAVLAAEEAPSAEVKVGLGIDKMEIKDASDSFKVAPDTRIYAWAKVTGCKDAGVAIAFEKDGKAVFAKDLAVPRSPYRTNAYRTFRAGDAGTWTVKVSTKDGKELVKAEFKVEISKD